MYGPESDFLFACYSDPLYLRRDRLKRSTYFVTKRA